MHNLLPFQSLLAAFTFPNCPSYIDIKARHNRPLPDGLRNACFDAMKHVLTQHPSNYFTLERLNTVPLLIERMDNEGEAIQDAVMDLVGYILDDLNFIPLKELAVISLHFQRE